MLFSDPTLPCSVILLLVAFGVIFLLRSAKRVDVASHPHGWTFYPPSQARISRRGWLDPRTHPLYDQWLDR